jgi:hypothetical protein
MQSITGDLHTRYWKNTRSEKLAGWPATEGWLVVWTRTTGLWLPGPVGWVQEPGQAAGQLS